MTRSREFGLSPRLRRKCSPLCICYAGSHAQRHRLPYPTPSLAHRVLTCTSASSEHAHSLLRQGLARLQPLLELRPHKRTNESYQTTSPVCEMLRCERVRRRANSKGVRTETRCRKDRRSAEGPTEQAREISCGTDISMARSDYPLGLFEALSIASGVTGLEVEGQTLLLHHQD